METKLLDTAVMAVNELINFNTTIIKMFNEQVDESPIDYEMMNDIMKIEITKLLIYFAVSDGVVSGADARTINAIVNNSASSKDYYKWATEMNIYSESFEQNISTILQSYLVIDNMIYHAGAEHERKYCEYYLKVLVTCVHALYEENGLDPDNLPKEVQELIRDFFDIRIKWILEQDDSRFENVKVDFEKNRDVTLKDKIDRDRGTDLVTEGPAPREQGIKLLNSM